MAFLQDGGTTIATLNVKKVPDALYPRLQAQAKRQRRSVAQEVIHLLSQALRNPNCDPSWSFEGWVRSAGVGSMRPGT